MTSTIEAKELLDKYKSSKKQFKKGLPRLLEKVAKTLKKKEEIFLFGSLEKNGKYYLKRDGVHRREYSDRIEEGILVTDYTKTYDYYEDYEPFIRLTSFKKLRKVGKRLEEYVLSNNI